MSIYFYIARHFWENGKNASWQVASDFPTELFDNFKNDYSLLENIKPDFRQYDSGTVFFNYKQSVDIYGRRITEITAATCGKRLRHPESLINLFQKKLQNFDNVTLSVIIDDSNISYEDNLQSRIETDTKNTGVSNASGTSNNKLVVAVLVVLIIIIGLFFFFKKNENIQAKSPHPQNTVAKETRQVPSSKDRQNKNSSRDVAKPLPQNIRKIFLEKYFKLKDLKKELPYIENKCVFFYIKNQTDKNQDRRSFKRWIKDVGKDKCKKCEHMKNVRKRIKELAGFLVDDGIDMDRKKIEDFFNGK